MNTLDISKGPFGKSVQANDKLCHELPKLTGPNCHKSTESQPPDYTESGETASCVVSGISEEVRVTLALEQLPDGELWNLFKCAASHNDMWAQGEKLQMEDGTLMDQKYANAILVVGIKRFGLEAIKVHDNLNIWNPDEMYEMSYVEKLYGREFKTYEKHCGSYYQLVREEAKGKVKVSDVDRLGHFTRMISPKSHPQLMDALADIWIKLRSDDNALKSFQEKGLARLSPEERYKSDDYFNASEWVRELYEVFSSMRKNGVVANPNFVKKTVAELMRRNFLAQVQLGGVRSRYALRLVGDHNIANPEAPIKVGLSRADFSALECLFGEHDATFDTDHVAYALDESVV